MINIKAYDYNNKPIKTPQIISYKHYIGRFGAEETFTTYFSKKISPNISKVIVSRRGKEDVTCFVNSITTETTKNGLVCKLELKNILCRIFENQLEPKSFENLTLNKIMEEYIKKYNITNSIKKFNNKNVYNFIAREFYIDFGMSAWDALQLFFENMTRKDIFLNEKKEITFPYLPKKPLYFGKYKNYGQANINGIDYTNYKYIDDRSKIISSCYVRLIEDEDPKNFKATNFKATNDENLYTTICGIKRVKYRNVPKQWAILPEYGSDYIIRKENKKRYRVEITTFEQVNAFPGMKGKIKEIDENEDFCVMEVYENVEEKGKKTKIIFRSNILE